MCIPPPPLTHPAPPLHTHMYMHNTHFSLKPQNVNLLSTKERRAQSHTHTHTLTYTNIHIGLRKATLQSLFIAKGCNTLSWFQGPKTSIIVHFKKYMTIRQLAGPSPWLWSGGWLCSPAAAGQHWHGCNVWLHAVVSGHSCPARLDWHPSAAAVAQPWCCRTWQRCAEEWSPSVYWKNVLMVSRHNTEMWEQ